MDQCVCGKTYRYQSGLIRHRRGNVKQGVLPCPVYVRSLVEVTQKAQAAEADDLLSRFETVQQTLKSMDRSPVEMPPDTNPGEEPKLYTNEGDDVGYIYLIRERESIRCRENKYKVGMTRQAVGDVRISRLESYKKGSEIIFLWQCIDACQTRHLESRVKKEFRKLFLVHDDGPEHFIGDRFQMVDAIMKVIAEYNASKGCPSGAMGLT